MKCCNNDDSLKIEYKDDPGDTVTFTFESPNQDRTSEFNIKLMTIDSEHLALTDEGYDSLITMPSSESLLISKARKTLSKKTLSTLKI